MYKNVSQKTDLSLDNVCYLISESVTSDDIGNQIPSPIEIMTFCAETSAFSSEFFNAGQQGIKPERVLIINSESYDYQTKAKYNDTVYTVYRSYVRPDGYTELYLTLKVGNQYG